MELIDIYILGKLSGMLETEINNPYFVRSDRGGDWIIDLFKKISEIIKKYNMVNELHPDIEEIINQLEKYKINVTLNYSDKVKLISWYIMFNDRIMNEIASKVTIEINTEGKINYKFLMEKGPEGFLKENWKRLSEITKGDLEDACRCLLRKLWTPAVMITLRASEDAVRQLYKYIMDEDAGKKGWRKILDELNPNIDNTTIIGHLDFIRDKRNKAEHPLKRFSQSESEDIFNTIIMTINEIYELIPIK